MRQAAAQAFWTPSSAATHLRAEPVLATPLPRWRWAAGHLAVALGGSVVLLTVIGTAAGLGYALTLALVVAGLAGLRRRDVDSCRRTGAAKRAPSPGRCQRLGCSP